VKNIVEAFPIIKFIFVGVNPEAARDDINFASREKVDVARPEESITEEAEI